MADSEIQISIVLDDGSVRQGFARISDEGKKSSATLSDSFSSLRNQLVALTGAYLSLRGLKDIFSAAVDAAAEQERALNKLNNALLLAGSFSKEASASFVQFADELQKTTTLQDDQVLSLAALARTYAKTNEQTKELTRAAIDLATATGVDVDTAVKQLGGTLSGVTGQLSKSIPALKSLTTAQLKAGEAIDIVAARFRGSAANEVNTFDGRIKQLKNSFGELLETLGDKIIKSPAALGIIRLVAEGITKLNDSFRSFSKNRDFVLEFVNSFADFGQLLVKYVLAPTELVINGVKLVFNTVLGFIQSFIRDFAFAASKIVNIIAPNSDLAKNLTLFAETTQETLQEFANRADPNKLFDFSISQKVSEGIESGRQAIEEASLGVTQPLKNIQVEQDNLIAKNFTLLQSFSELSAGFKEQAQSLADDVSKSFRQLGGQAIQGLSNSVAAGMAAIGRALVKGEDIFQAFAGAVLGALGQAAIQMGATYILMGIARAFSSYGLDPTAQGLIATGSALSVLGGALMAAGSGVSGGMGPNINGSPVGVGGGGTGGGGFTGDTVGNPSENMQEQRQTVAVNIQGDVLDSRETGLRIVDILNEAFDTSGAKVVTT